MVFIDDSEDNVKAAISRGMLGIVYKNAEELEKTFINMGLTVFYED